MRDDTERAKIEAVRRMQDYIEGRLNEPISLPELAEVARYSPWHAQRMFRELTGKALFEYIRSLRLSRAALELRDGTSRVLDIALDFTFATHEGFTRSFSREFGLAPSAYRLNPVPIRLFMPYRVSPRSVRPEGDRIMSETEKKSESEKKGGMRAIFTQVIERPPRKLLLKRGVKAEEYFAYCGEVGCEVWGVLSSVKEALYEPAGFWLPRSLRPAGTSLYVLGVELPADYAGPVPEGYELADLPPASMMVFQGEPYDDENFEAEIAEVCRKIDSFDPKLYGWDWDPDSAPRFQLTPEGWRGYIEARPVKSVLKK